MKSNKHSYKYLSDCIKVLAVDAINKANSGHPGMVLGMSDVFTVLAFEFLNFNPHDPKWYDRDRLILSAGHGSMLLYSLFYLAGYKNFSLEDIKNFRQLGSKTPGHPETKLYEAIESTTGPLGQGIANAVGMAIAQKKYNQRLGDAISNHKIYAIAGDGCLMEGISYEACSLAGHLKLNNLVIIFDDNKISIDGSTNLSTSEDHAARFKSQGWATYKIDGHSYEDISKTLQQVQTSNLPSFIACNTIIGKDSVKSGSEKSHGSPLNKEEITLLKQKLGCENQDFYVPDELLQTWRDSWLRNKDRYDTWQTNFASLNHKDQEYIRANHKIDYFTNITSSSPESTRASSGRVISDLTRLSDKIIYGSADLATSTFVYNDQSVVISASDFSGNFIHYGIREHAMAGIMNGLALSGFLPIGSTFLTFSDYMRPSIRLSAMMEQQVIYVMTHDSIGVGEDGPTHQPVEHLASLRAIPNLLVLRPADLVETVECWNIALNHTSNPSLLSLTRQNVPQIRKYSANNMCAKGIYPIDGDIDNNYDIAIFASGSEVSIAQETKKILEQHNRKIILFSVPSFELFFQQDTQYIKKVLNCSKHKVAIEAASSFGWHKIIGPDGMFFGVDHFGCSAPTKMVYEHFGLTPTKIAERIQKELA